MGPPLLRRQPAAAPSPRTHISCEHPPHFTAMGHAGGGVGGTPRGKSSICEQRNNGPTLTSENSSPSGLEQAICTIFS